MIVTRLEAVNWRNLRQVNVALERRVFAVGPNAGGKSNFLDAFRFLSDLAARGGGLYSAVEKRGGVGALESRAGKKDGFELAVTFGGAGSDAWKYVVGVRERGPGDPCPVLKCERVFRNGETVVDRPDADDRSDPVRLEQTFLESAFGNRGFRELAAFFAGTAYRNSRPFGGREEIRRRGEFAEASSDESVGGFLSDVVSAPPAVRKQRIAKIEAALQLVVPHFKKLELTKPGGERPGFESMFDHWRPGETLAQEHFSDGTLRLIGMLWALLENESLLLLEEPELSLHPSIVRHLPGLIYRLKRKRPGQTIVTTHSPELLSDCGIDGSEVLLFLPDEHGGVTVAPASDLPEVGSLIDAGLSIGEIVLPRSQPPRVEELGFFQ